jgi:hypothetical protein
MKTKTAASLVIHDAANMHRKGRKAIANWLRRQAGFLDKHADQLSKRYRASYRYS